MRRSARSARVCVPAAVLCLLLSSCGGGGGGGATGSVSATSPSNALPSGNSTVGVGWNAPSQRENGDTLSAVEIGGYRVYYGTASRFYIANVKVTGASSTNVTVDGLRAGEKYYFAVAAYDNQGLQSALSREVTVVPN